MVLPVVQAPPTQRQSEILARARVEGAVGVDGLAQDYDVTTQTIRRDLNELCQRGLLMRTHGGAVLANSVANVGYEERRALCSEEKRHIGLRAAELIPGGCSVIMNIGTTVEQVAHALRGHRDLMIVTNNMNIVNILSGSPGKELLISGGVVRQSDGAIVGEAAVDFMRGFKVDFAVIGASALDAEGAVMDFDIREVSVSRAIIGAARQTILVADGDKFDRRAPVRISTVEEIDAFVTDRAPPAPFREACARAGTRLIMARAARALEREDCQA